MAKIISLLNHKGGVAKTTTTLNLGAGLVERGYKVLLVDLDGQTNLTISLPQTQPYDKNMYGALVSKHELPIYKISENLDLAPSHIDLAAAESELFLAYERESVLKKLLEPVKEQYDYILIDCPPSIGILSINALKASESVIIPVVADIYGVLGLRRLYPIIQTLQQRLNPGLIIEGILFTIWDKTKIQRDAHKAISKDENLNKYIYKTKIRKNVQVRESPALKQNIFEYNPQSAGADDYNSFIKEFLSKQSK